MTYVNMSSSSLLLRDKSTEANNIVEQAISVGTVSDVSFSLG